jgi:hypothetical protein
MTPDDKRKTPLAANGGVEPQLAAAHDLFWTRLRDTWPSAQAERAVNDAYAAYTGILQEPWASPELGRRAANALGEYNTRLHDAFAGGRSRELSEAYRSYVRDLQRVWIEVDCDALTPQQLFAMAQGMSAVAGLVLQVLADEPSAVGFGSGL